MSHGHRLVVVALCHMIHNVPLGSIAVAQLAIVPPTARSRRLQPCEFGITHWRCAETIVEPFAVVLAEPNLPEHDSQVRADDIARRVRGEERSER